MDCRNFIERTGEACDWTSPAKDLCTACLLLLETDLGVLYVGQALHHAEMARLSGAGLRTVGQVFNLGSIIPLPRGITSKRAAELREEAMVWIKKQFKLDLLRNVTRATFLIDLVTGKDFRRLASRIGRALEDADLVTVGDLLDRAPNHPHGVGLLQKVYSLLKETKGVGVKAAHEIGDALVDEGLLLEGAKAR